MAVTVIGTNPRTVSGIDYEAAHNVDVRDGHLYVLGDDSKKLAIYAPSTWARAEVTK
jgi:hypothetical protein